MKRLLCAALAALMLASIIVAPAPAKAADTEITRTDTTQICSCGCRQKLENIQWKPWDPNNGASATSGHYYLEGDYCQQRKYQANPAMRIVVDLRGHTLTIAEVSPIFSVYGYVAVLDTVGGGRIAGNGSTSSGGVVAINLDLVAMNETLDGTFELYNCTVTLADGVAHKKPGGLISMGDGTNFRAYGSCLTGANASGHGGAMWVSGKNARAELKDTSIIGCSSQQSGGAIYSTGIVTLENCHISGNTAQKWAGNIYQNGGALTIKNSVFENNITYDPTYGGGNLYVTGDSIVRVSDSTLRNGYAAAYGGNVYLTKGNHTFTNTTISGGVAGLAGANVYCNGPAAATTFEDCHISGDMYFGRGSLTLKGATKIALNSTGLKLPSGTVITAGDLSGDAEIFVDATGVFTESDVNSAYFKPAFRTALSSQDGCLKGTQTANAEAGFCPHCDQAVSWSAFSGSGSGHFYLTQDMDISSAYEIGADVVLDLDGYDITSADRVFTVAQGGALALIDRTGGSVINGSGNTDGLGGVIANAGTLKIYGGNYIYHANSEKPLTKGGVIYATGEISLQGGLFDGSAFDRTAEDCLGGAIYQADNAGSFTMSAGYIIGGTAYSAGGVFIGGNNNITITGGTITGGTATKTIGNLSITGNSSCSNGVANITGLAVTNGTAETGNAGNMSLCYYKQSYMTGCYLSGGSCENGKGGNFYGTIKTYLTFTDCIFFRGNAKIGGNVHNNSNVGELTLINCLLAEGNATGNGGNLSCTNGRVTVQGGAYLFGSAGNRGGNLYNEVGAYDSENLLIQKSASGKAPLIAKGHSGAEGGNIYNNGKLTLEDAKIYNGTASSGSDIYHSSGTASMLTLGENLSGNIYMAFARANLGSGIYGQPIAKISAAKLNAQLILETIEGAPQACLSDGQIYVSSATVNTVDGREIWYRDNAAALDACPANGWVKLYSNQPLVLTRDCFVDLNGKAVTVSGHYTLYGMDSSGDDYSVSAGSAKTATGTMAAAVTDAPNGNRYIAVAEGTSVSYHRLEMGLTDVTIRTENCGIYYKGIWGCDSVLAEKIDTYGIAVSLDDMPKADFAEDPCCLSVEYDGEELTSGETKSGVLITNIMKSTLSSRQNARRGEMPIYAAGYVKLTDGMVIVSDKEGETDDVAFSLRTAMERMDTLIAEDPALFVSDTVHTARNFRAQWENLGMENWTFNKLVEPTDDGILKILILGSSRSVNTFQLLYQVFKDQMPDNEFVFGVMYYSGCSMTMHKNFIQNNSYVYDYYCNDSGRWNVTSGVNMDAGLYAQNWDVVLLQAGTGDLSNQMNLSTRNFLKDYIDDRMLDPYELWWHSTWFNSTDPDLNPNGATVDQVAQLKETNDAARAYVLNDPMFAGHIASGTPVLYAIKELGVPETKLFRDHTHLFDFGCLLVGYSFYAQFTGKAVTEINIEKIPYYLRQREYQLQGDVPVTEEDKKIIIDAVAYTMQDPWAVPGAQ